MARGISRLSGTATLNILASVAASSYFNRLMGRFFVALFLLVSASAAEARDHIWAAGSSTVYPFATSAAEHFGRRTEFRTPVVESIGTGGGFKLFCSGAGVNTPDMSNASRAIKDSEIALCNKNGVKQIIPVKIGLDGIVFANAAASKHFRLTRREIFLSLAKEVPVNGKLVSNPYKTWNQINPSFPNQKIEVFGPPPTSGTRDAFVELVMHPSCEHVPEFEAAYPDAKKRQRVCGAMREDGVFAEAGEDDNLMVQQLAASPQAFGIVGFSTLEENSDKVQGSAIEGVAPTFENVTRGTYPVSRPLFIYAKGEHIGLIPGLKEFMLELSRESTIGDEGYLAEKGLIPLPKEEREELRKRITTSD